MDAAAELGRNSVSKHQIQPEYGDEQADAGWDCRTRLARPILRRKRGQGKIIFPCFISPVQLTVNRDWQPYPVDPYPALLYMMTIHTHVHPLRHTAPSPSQLPGSLNRLDKEQPYRPPDFLSGHTHENGK